MTRVARVTEEIRATALDNGWQVDEEQMGAWLIFRLWRGKLHLQAEVHALTGDTSSMLGREADSLRAVLTFLSQADA